MSIVLGQLFFIIGGFFFVFGQVGGDLGLVRIMVMLDRMCWVYFDFQ